MELFYSTVNTVSVAKPVQAPRASVLGLVGERAFNKRQINLLSTNL